MVENIATGQVESSGSLFLGSWRSSLPTGVFITSFICTKI